MQRDHIERLTNLPTIPQMAMRLMDLVRDPEVSIRTVADVVRQDVSLSAKMLRLANSAFYGMPRTVTNINDALVVLGLQVVGTLVMSLAVFDLFPSREKEGVRFDRAEFWHHCLTTALIARMIAQKLPGRAVDPEDAFCSGLLHDIGKVVIDQYFHEDIDAVMGQMAQGTTTWSAAEAAALDYTHTDVAEWLISRWNLPEIISVPMIHHHQPGGAGRCADHAFVCHLADHLSYVWSADGAADAGSLPMSVGESLHALGLQPAVLDACRAQFPAELEKAAVIGEIFDRK